MTTQETAYDYHCREFSEFYEENQRQEYGDDQTLWEDKDDFASSLFSTLDDYRQEETNPFQLVAYSAGVYLGEANGTDADAYPVLPGLENLPYAPSHLNLWTFYDRFDNPDAHADGADDCLREFVEAVRSDNEELPPREDLDAALLSFMKCACPAYTAVLWAWNKNLSEEAFWEFWAETHIATYENYLD